MKFKELVSVCLQQKKYRCFYHGLEQVFVLRIRSSEGEVLYKNFTLRNCSCCQQRKIIRYRVNAIQKVLRELCLTRILNFDFSKIKIILKCLEEFFKRRKNKSLF